MTKVKQTLVVVAALAALGVAACAGPAGSPEPATSSGQGQTAPESDPRPVDDGEDTVSVGGPVTILDTIDPDDCSFVHNINACFSDGEPPAGIPLDEYMDLYFAAREDLVLRAGADPALVKILSVQRVDWADASLGVPEPGVGYAQVITPGFRLVLEAAGESYAYHAGGGRVVFAAEAGS